MGQSIKPFQVKSLLKEKIQTTKWWVRKEKKILSNTRTETHEISILFQLKSHPKYSTPVLIATKLNSTRNPLNI